MKKTVSVIIPIYNVEKYVEKSILSALDQTFTSIEYIIVDDCGSDNSMDLVRCLIESHQRNNDVYIFSHNENKGLSGARNTGIDNAHGDYIFFMDSDDELEPDCIELHYNRIVEVGADFTIGQTVLVGKKKSIHIDNYNFNIIKDSGIQKSFLYQEWPFSGWNKLYKLDYVTNNNLRFIENRLHEDMAWSFDLALSATLVAYVDKNTYKYISRESSITTSKVTPKRLEDLYYMIEYTFSRYNEVDKSLSYSFHRYISYLKLIYATQLFVSELSYNERKAAYQKLQNIPIIQFSDKFSLIMSLTWEMFYTVFYIPYIIYKKYIVK